MPSGELCVFFPDAAAVLTISKTAQFTDVAILACSLNCIRNWRATSTADVDTAVRTCPVCRTQCFFITPSGGEVFKLQRIYVHRWLFSADLLGHFIGVHTRPEADPDLRL